MQNELHPQTALLDLAHHRIHKKRHVGVEDLDYRRVAETGQVRSRIVDAEIVLFSARERR